MIELSPTTALMTYLGLTLLSLLGVWAVSHYNTRHKKILPLERELHICEFCSFAYLDTNAKKVTKCPRCESFNKH